MERGIFLGTRFDPLGEESGEERSVFAISEIDDGAFHGFE